MKTENYVNTELKKEVDNKPINNLLSREDRIFVSLAAQILVTKTINDATKSQSSKISPLQ